MRRAEARRGIGGAMISAVILRMFVTIFPEAIDWHWISSSG
jgi:hypothetical protein